MKRYFFRILLAGLALPFSGISQDTANPGNVDTAGRGRVTGPDSAVSVPKQDQAGTVLTLKECVDLAIKNNLAVNNSETDRQTARVNAQQATELMLPSINASVSQGVNFGRSIANTSNGYVDQQQGTGSYSASGSLLLFNGLYVQHYRRQTSLAYTASKLDLQQQKDNITLNVIVQYTLILTSRDQLAIARQIASVDSSTVKRLEVENLQGAISPSDLSDLQGQYAGDLAQVAQLQNTLESNKITLFNYLNIPYRRDAVYEQIGMQGNNGELGNSSDSLFQTALQIVPMIRANDLRVQSARQGVAAARGKYYPTLSLGANIGSAYSSLATSAIPGTEFEVTTGQYVKIGGVNQDVFSSNIQSKKTVFSDQLKNNRNEFVGFSLNIPILNYLQTRNNVKLAKINVTVQQNVATASKNQLQQAVEQSWQNLKSAYELFKQYDDQSKAFAKSFHAAQVKFDNGAINSVEYIIVKNKYDQSSVNLAAAKYSVVFRQRILDYYQGNLKW